MAAALQRTSFNIREAGQTVQVPNDKRAKLMYYLNCINCVLEFDDDNALRHFRDYSNYSYISSITEKKQLVALCVLLRPDLLEDKCISNVENIGENSNTFIELERRRDLLVLSRAVVINGQQKEAKMIMLYKMQWMMNNYFNPLKALVDEIEREETRLSQPTQKKDCICTIL